MQIVWKKSHFLQEKSKTTFFVIFKHCAITAMVVKWMEFLIFDNFLGLFFKHRSTCISIVIANLF